MIDTHAHLQWPDFDKDREDVIERAFTAGLSAIVSVGYDLDACREAVRIANSHDGVYAAVGIHPHNARLVDAKALDSLRELAHDRRVVAIGEIGLDYYRDLSPRQRQREAFEKQVGLAQELGLPIVVHDREAHGDVMQVLRNSAADATGVMHCFSGSLEMAREVVDLGYLISIAGPVTFPNARKLHEVVRWVPEESLVFETDCPWLAPQSVRGKRNEPSFLSEIALKVSELKGTSFDRLIQVTSRNARRLFSIQ